MSCNDEFFEALLDASYEFDPETEDTKVLFDFAQMYRACDEL